MAIYAHFLAGDFDPKIGQSGLVCVCDERSLVGLCTQDYKSLRAGQLGLRLVSPWLASRQTHRQHFDQLV